MDDPTRHNRAPDGDSEQEKTSNSATPDERQAEGDETTDPLHPNPPYTTTKWLTAPEFGAAGSGGAEYEPGPETD